MKPWLATSQSSEVYRDLSVGFCTPKMVHFLKRLSSLLLMILFVLFIVRHFLNTAINGIIPGCFCYLIVLKVLNRSVPGGQKISLTPASILLVTSSDSFEMLRK